MVSGKNKKGTHWPDGKVPRKFKYQSDKRRK